MTDQRSESPVLSIITAQSKDELNALSRSVVVRQEDLVEVILHAMTNAETPLRHRPIFQDHLPTDLEITEKDLEQLRHAKVGDSVRMGPKLGQIFRQRRRTNIHLFDVEDSPIWCLFIFDFQDIATRGNHWKDGPHVHVISWLTHPRPDELAGILEQLTSNPPNRPKGLHFRFQEITR